MSESLPKVGDRYSAEEIARFYEAGYWTPLTMINLVERWALERPEMTFVTDADTSLTFAELHTRALQLAAGLSSSGIGAGDRVVIQLPNWTDFVVAVVAVAWCRAIVVPIMTIYRHDEVQFIVSHSGAKAAITCAEFGGFSYAGMYEDLRAACPALSAVYLARTEETTADCQPLSAIMATGDPTALRDAVGGGPSADDGHLIIYTSGTTARPKGCFHTWNTMSFTARVMAQSLKCGADDVAFGPSPVAHGTGYMTSVIIPLLSGGRSHLMEAWEPVAAMERIARFACTTAVTATPFIQMLLDAYDPAAHDLSSLRLWVAAGSPIPGTVVERARAAWPALEVLSLYGRSENFVTTLCESGCDPHLSTMSDGKAPAGVEVVAVDEQGTVLGPGQEGDLCYRGPGHMIEYFRQPDLTEEMFTNEGFSRSGDLGYVNEQGYARVTGRVKDIIIRGGLNISAVEVENLLLGHPVVQNVAVVAMPDERLVEKACAYVVPETNAKPSLADLTTYLRDEHDVAVQKLPERLEIVQELPMTATGKIQKHLLRADIAAKMEAERT